MRLLGLVAALFVIAFPLEGSAYTLKSTEGGDQLHWREREVTLTISSSVNARFGLEGAREALDAAIAAWSPAPFAPRIILSDREARTAPGYTRGQAENGVYLVSPWPYEPKLLAVTVSSFDTRTGALLDADILLNGDEDIGLGEGEHYDLIAVLSHELGHVLGLGESDEHPAATMYPRIARADRRARQPGSDDFAGIAALYASRGEVAPSPVRRFPSSLGALFCFGLGAAILVISPRPRPRSRRPILESTP